MAEEKEKQDPKELKVSVASLGQPEKCGWCTKQGGAIKTWKRRWFVLKGTRLWYFAGKNDDEAKGYIQLEGGTIVRDESTHKKKKNMFSIQARGFKGRRVFYVTAETMAEVKEWLDAIKENVRRINNPDKPKAAEPTEAAVKSDPASPRTRINAAKAIIPFLQEEDSKVLEFWQIWSESIPAKEDVPAGQAIEFVVAVSADMEKLTWRTSGPQNIFIQKMVDFFWNVGAPEPEIDRLNDVGALINPVKIGSWIDMSNKGGMDGGWYFPVDIPVQLAISAADAGEATRKVMEWVEAHGITQCYSVGRDMGAAPPRQTEIRLKLIGADAAAQIALAQDAFLAFGFPALPEAAVSLYRQMYINAAPAGESLAMSIITSCEGFVRLGLLIPKPGSDYVASLIDLAGGKKDGIAKFEATIGGLSPSYAEYQYLMKGFGYGVYKEGFDVVFHWAVGEEHGPQ